MLDRDISISKPSYDSAMEGLLAATENLAPVPASPPELTCRAATLIKYRQRLLELDRLMGAYRSLLEKDYQVMRGVQRALEGADQALSQNLVR